MTKSEMLFKFGKQVAILQWRIQFTRESIHEAFNYEDDSRIEFEEKLGNDLHLKVLGIVEVASEQFNVKAEAIYLLASNLTYEFSIEEIEAMKENPYKKKKGTA